MCAKRILTVGSTNIDFVLTTPYLPAPGETLRSGGEYSFMPGGKGANAAAAAAAFGADSVFCTRVGDDAYGDRMLRALEERGINTKYVRVDRHEQTGLAVITVEKDGTNRIIVYPGANDKINLGDLEAAFTCYPDAVLVQFEINRDTVISAARLAADESIPLIVDAGPATPDFPLEKLERVEILTPNETETEILTGIRPNSFWGCWRMRAGCFLTTKASAQASLRGNFHGRWYKRRTLLSQIRKNTSNIGFARWQAACYNKRCMGLFFEGKV